MPDEMESDGIEQRLVEHREYLESEEVGPTHHYPSGLLKEMDAEPFEFAEAPDDKMAALEQLEEMLIGPAQELEVVEIVESASEEGEEAFETKDIDEFVGL